MDKNERRYLQRQAFLHHLEAQLIADQQQYTLPVAPSPIANLGPHIDGPFAANKNAMQDLWHRAENGAAGTGVPVSDLHGAAHQSAAEAHIGGGSIANGGGGRAAAPGNLRRAGLSATGSSLLGWGALIGCEVAMQAGPPLVTAIWHARREVRAAERAEHERDEG